MRIGPPIDRQRIEVSDLVSSQSTEVFDPANSELLAAEFGGVLIGGIQWQAFAGRLIGLTPPIVIAGSQESRDDQTAIPESVRQQAALGLASEAVMRLRHQTDHFIQCLVDKDDFCARKALESAGLVEVTDIEFMRCSAADFPDGSQRSGQHFQTDAHKLLIPHALVDQDQENRFLAVLSRTYEDSLDCRALAGIRSPADNWEMHRGVPGHRPDLWRIYSLGEGLDVGVLMMNEINGPEPACQILYLGIDPEHRGKQFCRAILRQMLFELKQEGICWVDLAVDAVNVYAKRVYDSLGFVRIARKTLFAYWQ